MAKAKGKTNIGIAVLFDGSSVDGCKIVTLRTGGSVVIQTTLASITRDGMHFIRAHGLKRMLDASGISEIAALMENGKKND